MTRLGGIHLGRLHTALKIQTDFPSHYEPQPGVFDSHVAWQWPVLFACFFWRPPVFPKHGLYFLVGQKLAPTTSGYPT